MALATGRTGSFAVDVWSQNYQTEIAAVHSGVRCDSLGCIVETPDYSIAIVANAAAFAEDCGAHDLVIARVYAPENCNPDGVYIGPSELLRRSALAALGHKCRAVRRSPGYPQFYPALASFATVTPAAAISAPPTT
ncbi:hypothetical protein [Devosia aurantiaca]|uniref:Uncharacterized protein n=1 Tax=Devosia aurantiaca TaxID=2714858 RepID=A0A6M1SCS1_9HYPH|nr:hypothetical protein [Devosia aurantiaca]NGP17709.1 hypothetical protein [Devosia aurantiaca]